MNGPATVSARPQLLYTYGRLHRARPLVVKPASVDELRRTFAWAREGGRSLSLMAARHSFDEQPLHSELVVDCLGLDRIGALDRDTGRLTVEGGVRWERIVETAKAAGFTPHVVVTTGKATAGGTISANCLSRSSPLYGKEGKHVERLSLLTTTGELLECSCTQNADVFRAVVGGFGYLGAIVDATIRLLPVGERTRVETEAHAFGDLDSLLAALSDATLEPGDWNAVYSVAFFARNSIKGILFRARYTANKRSNPLLINRPDNVLNIPVQLLARFSGINNLAWDRIHAGIEKNSPYFDDLEGYHFFMDGHRKAKEFALKFGFAAPTLQQTFVLPDEGLRPFFAELDETLRRHDLTPNLFDVLYVPADDFLLSSGNGLAGWAISVAFDDLNRKRIALLREQLTHMSERCIAVGGRVHLVKNVEATSEQLGRMYGNALPAFLELKHRLDPGFVLRNPFFGRLFGSLAW